jgi:hypothetical protein
MLGQDFSSIGCAHHPAASRFQNLIQNTFSLFLHNCLPPRLRSDAITSSQQAPRLRHESRWTPFLQQKEGNRFKGNKIIVILSQEETNKNAKCNMKWVQHAVTMQAIFLLDEAAPTGN